MNHFLRISVLSGLVFVLGSSLIIESGIRAQESDETLGVEYTEGHVDSDGVKIHYVTAGEGPLLVMIHGFPDYWYSWRDQIPALAEHFQVVAIDQRGYNLSDQPEGVAAYAMPKLVGDVVAVIDHFEADKAVIVGHDWGGAVAWNLTMRFPDRVDRLVILNLPHPRGLFRELSTNPDQQKNSQYARDFQQEDAADKIQSAQLAGWVAEPEARQKYVEAFERSSIEGMLNYYKANYPRTSAPSDSEDAPTAAAAVPPMPQVQCPVLMFHGLDDQALLPAGLNGTWDWIDNELTIVTIPGAGHFVQRDASESVTRHMVRWLSD
ncbi:MAG: alpha/beta fold hydrolase [Pirellulaceae bacterium]